MKYPFLKRVLATIVLSLLLANNVAFATAWDVSTASNSGVTKSVSAQDSSVEGVEFNSDGSKMFILGDVNDTVFEYALSTNYDISTATYSGSGEDLAMSADGISTPLGFDFSNDGLKLYVQDRVDQGVYEYDLSTGFDVSTAEATPYFKDFSAQIVGGTAGGDITFSTASGSEGLKMFLFDQGTVYEYTLSSAYDLSSATYSQSYSLAAVTNAIQGVAFNITGTKLFIADDSTSAKIAEFSLSTGFDVSTASNTNDHLDIQGVNSTPTGLAFSSDGLNMYHSGTNIVYWYTLPDASAVPEFSTYVYIVTVLILIGVMYNRRELLMGKA